MNLNLNLPYPDEHLISWIDRLATINSYDSGDYLLVSRYNLDRKQILRALNIHGQIPKLPLLASDVSRVVSYHELLSMTLYPVYQAFASDRKIEQMEEFLANGFRPGALLPRLTPKYRVCKQCQMEDMDTYGVSYLHISHQIPGIILCLKHKTSLVDMEIGEDITTNRIYSNESEYHAFISGFLSYKEGVTKSQIISAMKCRLDDMDISCDLSELGDIRYETSRFIYGTLSDIATAIEVCVSLFGSWDVLERYLHGTSLEINRKDYFTEMELKIHDAVGSDYTVVSELDNEKVILRHESCKKEFPIRLIYVLNGQRCPHCKNPSTEKLERIFKKYGHDGILITDDINRDDYHNYRTHLERCYREGKIDRLANGIYARTGVTATDQELIIRKYIGYEGNIIGYLFATSFLHELGLMSAPEVMKIATNRVSRDHCRTTKLNNTAVSVRPGRRPITNENASILQVLDILVNLEKYQKKCISKILPVLAEHCIKNDIDKDLLIKYSFFYADYIEKNIKSLIQMMGDKEVNDG